MGNIYTNYLETLAPISEGLKEALVQCMVGPYPVKKGTILLREGEVSDRAYFVVKGMLRLYYTVKKKQVTSRFLPEYSTVIPYYSYFSQQPSYESLDVLEDSELIMVTRADFEGLYAFFPELHNLMRQQLAKSVVWSDERSMMLRKLSAKERLEALLQKFPDIFLRASVEQIASFLGVSRETLSRIRSHR
ncbi:Crp/Fnr family transcriptional regulator [Rufibacter ruber]|uniref:Crp/Fnr family transcriptional regulator n=1 Tax=Rufibacter ruber TaxID=1783499 RepID=UPI0008357114|nr:Crp/Fnr family transcriptional regulator [Rufibacter ruber]